ncbi:MAG: 6-phosphogluconolactonase, partial [Planctomycetes bacterium]|nr:6-phosphogluconolactonase [Planctomycetota bacterium]
MGISATKNYKPNVEVVSELESLSRRTVELFVADAKKAIGARGIFCVAISGGDTPKRFFELLSEVPESKALPWDKVHLFWVDERYVPPDSEKSNYKLAADSFLGKVGIPEENVHRIPTEYDDYKVAASHYEEAIQTVFGLDQGQIPEFDLIVL